MTAEKRNRYLSGRYSFGYTVCDTQFGRYSLREITYYGRF